jgi:hypothetical protein
MIKKLTPLLLLILIGCENTSPEEFYWEEFFKYPNGQISREETDFGFKEYYVNGNLSTEYKYYKETEGFFIVGGPYDEMEYYSNGNLKSIRSFLLFEQFPFGTWYEYYPDSSIKKEIIFWDYFEDSSDEINLKEKYGSNNFLHTRTPNGTFSQFYPNGQTWIEGEFFFLMDEVYKDGVWKHYSSEGKLINEYKKPDNSDIKIESHHIGNGSIESFISLENSMEESFVDY